MRQLALAPDVIVYNAVLDAVGTGGQLAKVEQLMDQMKVDGIQPDDYTYNSNTVRPAPIPTVHLDISHLTSHLPSTVHVAAMCAFSSIAGDASFYKVRSYRRTVQLFEEARAKGVPLSSW